MLEKTLVKTYWTAGLVRIIDSSHSSAVLKTAQQEGSCVVRLGTHAKTIVVDAYLKGQLTKVLIKVESDHLVLGKETFSTLRALFEQKLSALNMVYPNIPLATYFRVQLHNTANSSDDEFDGYSILLPNDEGEDVSTKSGVQALQRPRPSRAEVMDSLMRTFVLKTPRSNSSS